MNQRSIRTRLTIWYTAVLSLAILLFSLVVWIALQHLLFEDLEQVDLVSEAEAVRHSGENRMTRGGAAGFEGHLVPVSAVLARPAAQCAGPVEEGAAQYVGILRPRRPAQEHLHLGPRLRPLPHPLAL